jgi:hypothetical protein
MSPRTNGGGFADLFTDDGTDPLDNKPLPPKRSKRVRVAGDTRYIGCPLWWFKLALSIMPHSSHELAVALYVYRLRIVHHSKTVSVSNERLDAELGVNRSAKYRALEKLAAAGVIRIRRRNKQAWTVTFIDRKSGSTR